VQGLIILCQSGIYRLQINLDHSWCDVHCVRKKLSQRIFSIILLGLMKFNKTLNDLSGHNCSCISNEACVIPLPETFYFNEEQKWRLLVECRKLDHLIVVAAISQWYCRLSACVRAHGGHFEHILWCFYGSVY